MSIDYLSTQADLWQPPNRFAQPVRSVESVKSVVFHRNRAAPPLRWLCNLDQDDANICDRIKDHWLRRQHLPG